VCGIVGLQLRDGSLTGRLGELLIGMLAQVRERGPDSAGIGIYGDPSLSTVEESAVSVIAPGTNPELLRAALGAGFTVHALAEMRVISAGCPVAELEAAVRAAAPDVTVTSTGAELVVLKGVGDPLDIAGRFALAGRAGFQGIGHTRLATESAVTSAHGHPFSVRPDLGFVHNGSFANHDTIRRRLMAEGVTFDTDNDTEVGARFVGRRLDEGDSLEKALRLLCETFDGFYTLLVTTAAEFAVVRDAVACKPALLAETPHWVAMASEYRALDTLPGIERARVFEPAPEEVYLWRR
jgi:glutamate synthase domain-containing protein 1